MADLDDRKVALIARLGEHRAQLAESVQGMRERMDLSRRLKASLATHRLAWLGGAAVLGILLTRWRPRQSRTERHRGGTTASKAGLGFALPVLKFLFELARPVLVPLVATRLAEFVARQTAPKRGTPR